MSWDLWVISFVSAFVAIGVGNWWERRKGYLICTPEQVVEAVSVEYRAQSFLTATGSVVLVADKDERASAERIAANLIQLTQKER